MQLGLCIRGFVGSAMVSIAGFGCGAATPSNDSEYPALVFPAHLPPNTKANRPGQAAPAASPPAASLSSSRRAATPDSSAASSASPAPGDSGKNFTVHTQHGDLPDPEPLSERAWWSFPLTYDHGAIVVGEPQLVCVPRPQPTPRRIGRFAFELWVGRELVDRLRFDFPLLAAEEPREGPRRPLRETPRFAPGAHVSVTLRLPASERATSARVFDRATGDAVAVDWPPKTSDGNPRPRECPSAGPGGKPAQAHASPANARR
jgi:hypothetical protein